MQHADYVEASFRFSSATTDVRSTLQLRQHVLHDLSVSNVFATTTSLHQRCLPLAMLLLATRSTMLVEPSNAFN